MSNFEEAFGHVERLVRVMKACDPEYCAAHDWTPCDDEQWDEALAEAEDFLEFFPELLTPDAKDSQP